MKIELTPIEIKYLNFLRDVEKQMKNDPTISLGHIIKNHHVNINSAGVLKSGGVIKNNGIVGAGCRWFWVSKVPANIEMARTLLQKLSAKAKVSADSIRESGKPKRKYTRALSVLRTQQPDSKKSFSILWGLVKWTR